MPTSDENSNWTDVPGQPGMRVYNEEKTLEYFKAAEQKYRDAITGTDARMTGKLIRGLKGLDQP